MRGVSTEKRPVRPMAHRERAGRSGVRIRKGRKTDTDGNDVEGCSDHGEAEDRSEVVKKLTSRHEVSSIEYQRREQVEHEDFTLQEEGVLVDSDEFEDDSDDETDHNEQSRIGEKFVEMGDQVEDWKYWMESIFCR